MLSLDLSKLKTKSPQRASKREIEASQPSFRYNSAGEVVISPADVFEALTGAIIGRLQDGGEVLISSPWIAAHYSEQVLELALTHGATPAELHALTVGYLATHSFIPPPQPFRPSGPRVYAMVYRKNRPPQGHTLTPLQFRILEAVETRFYRSEVVLSSRSIL